MGGERASTTRQREAGKICWRCGILLDPPPPGHKPGFRTGARGYGNQERLCPRCTPSPDPQSDAQTEPQLEPDGFFSVLCNISRHGWSVHFFEGRTRLGPWLLCDGEDHVRRILRWGNATQADLATYDEHIRAWGQTGVHLRLTRMQRASLIARGRGWPWNGYELLQMRAAGTYPPQRLTPAQEQAFLRDRRL